MTKGKWPEPASPVERERATTAADVLTQRPRSYDDMIGQIMAAQDPAAPAFANERECREWMSDAYPRLEANFDAIVKLASGGFMGADFARQDD